MVKDVAELLLEGVQRERGRSLRRFRLRRGDRVAAVEEPVVARVEEPVVEPKVEVAAMP